MKRILHVLGSLGRGGVETWLMHVWRNIDRKAFQFDFLLHTTEKSVYEDEAQELGSRILRCPETAHPLRYRRKVREILRHEKPYDAVHSHVHYFSFLPLAAAKAEGVRQRIAHSHQAHVPRKLHRAVYENMARWQLFQKMTHGLAISKAAGAGLFGNRWQESEKVAILLYGFDFSPYAKLADKRTQQQKLGLPPGRKIIGHVGRFYPQKNHLFLIDIFKAVIGLGVDAHLALVGTGPLLSQVKDRLREYGLEDRCTFAGDRQDVASWMGAMDLFLFPSLYEGLGIVALEAQAAGTTLLVSEHLPTEIEVIRRQIFRMRLESGAQEWARIAQRLLSQEPEVNAKPWEELQRSTFGISRCIADLAAVYCENATTGSSRRRSGEADVT